MPESGEDPALPARRFALPEVADLHERCVPSSIGLSANHLVTSDVERGTPGMDFVE